MERGREGERVGGREEREREGGREEREREREGERKGERNEIYSPSLETDRLHSQ